MNNRLLRLAILLSFVLLPAVDAAAGTTGGTSFLPFTRFLEILADELTTTIAASVCVCAVAYIGFQAIFNSERQSQGYKLAGGIAVFSGLIFGAGFFIDELASLAGAMI